MARSVGTLVTGETTSKEIRVLSTLRVCEDMNVAKSVDWCYQLVGLRS